MRIIFPPDYGSGDHGQHPGLLVGEMIGGGWLVANGMEISNTNRAG